MGKRCGRKRRAGRSPHNENNEATRRRRGSISMGCRGDTRFEALDCRYASISGIVEQMAVQDCSSATSCRPVGWAFHHVTFILYSTGCKIG